MSEYVGPMRSNRNFYALRNIKYQAAENLVEVVKCPEIGKVDSRKELVGISPFRKGEAIRRESIVVQVLEAMESKLAVTYLQASILKKPELALVI